MYQEDQTSPSGSNKVTVQDIIIIIDFARKSESIFFHDTIWYPLLVLPRYVYHISVGPMLDQPVIHRKEWLAQRHFVRWRQLDPPEKNTLFHRWLSIGNSRCWPNISPKLTQPLHIRRPKVGISGWPNVILSGGPTVAHWWQDFRWRQIIVTRK